MGFALLFSFQCQDNIFIYCTHSLSV